MDRTTAMLMQSALTLLAHLIVIVEMASLVMARFALVNTNQQECTYRKNTITYWPKCLPFNLIQTDYNNTYDILECHTYSLIYLVCIPLVQIPPTSFLARVFKVITVHVLIQATT